MPATYKVKGAATLQGPWGGCASGRESGVQVLQGRSGVAVGGADGTTHEIAWWEPNRFLVTFDPNDGAGGVATQVVQVTGTTYVLPADPARVGSTFAGWWTEAAGGARVTAVTQVALTRPHTFYAHWAFNRYSVVFDTNGGEGEMAAQELTVATAATLPECCFMRIGYAFAGWATEPGGEAVYTNAAEVLNLSYERGRP